MKKNIPAVLLSGLLLAVSAQASQKVNISFPFRTPAGELPAGKYLIEMRDTASARMVQMTNLDTKGSVIFLPETTLSNLRGTDGARLTFACAANQCNLTHIWSNELTGYTIRQKRPAAPDAEQLTIVLRTQQATE